jgi:hypothetical protein
MIRRIIETTDGKFIGDAFDCEANCLADGSDFRPTNTQDLGAGLVRYSNSNYVILTKEDS